MDICRQHIRFAALPQMRPARAERWMRTPGFREHLEFHRADCMGSHQQLEIYEHALARFEQLSPKCAPVIFGRDVLGLGVPSGPEVGSLLREVQRVMDERDAAPTRAEALVLLRDAVSRRRQGGG